MTLEAIDGSVKFKIQGQEAFPRWLQQKLKRDIEAGEVPPEGLRFQCRIAKDARENLRLIELANGETLRLSPSAKPQFGKNHQGRPYLTATMIYSGDGESYRIRWTGDAVPQEMVSVAVRHDRGFKVSPKEIKLDLSKAEITPSHKAVGPWQPHKSQRDYKKEDERRGGARRVKGGVSGNPRRKRTCQRSVESDLAPSGGKR